MNSVKSLIVSQLLSLSLILTFDADPKSGKTGQVVESYRQFLSTGWGKMLKH